MSVALSAILSGVLGATASCLGKVAFSDSSPLTRAIDSCRLLEGVEGQVALVWGRYDNDVACDFLLGSVRVCCFVLMIVMNVFMVGAFIDGMEESGSVAGTGLATATNFCVAAVYGYLVWDEVFSLTWMVGLFLVVIGVALLSTVTVIDGRKMTAPAATPAPRTVGKKED